MSDSNQKSLKYVGCGEANFSLDMKYEIFIEVDLFLDEEGKR